ncbi:MAG: hypothetical protein ACRECD_05905 [Burkholderiaceae bacterium]
MSKPNTPSTKPSNKANTELLQKGILCALIGLGVLISPYFIKSPGMQSIVANSSLVGWFALVLGCAFIVRYVVRRISAGSK